MPKLSIIVPVYNTYQYLEECINGILQQLNSDIELIIVDDGSNDNKSATLCDSFKEKNNNIIVIHKENGGISSARNTGIKIATGEYVLFVDSDDVLTDNILSKISNDIESNPNISIFAYDYLFYDGEQTLPTNSFLQINNFDDKLEHFKYLLCNTKNNWCVWNKVYNKNLIKDIFFTETLRFAEDLEWSFKVFDKANKILTLNETIIKYRINNNSSLTKLASSQHLINLLNVIKIANEILLKQHFNELEKKHFISIINRNLLSVMSQLQNFNKAEKKLLSNEIKPLLKYLKLGSRKSDKFAYFFSKLLGIKATGKLLNYYKKKMNKK